MDFIRQPDHPAVPDACTRLILRGWMRRALFGRAGRDADEMWADAKSYLIPRLTPEQWEMAIEVLKVVIPILVAML